MQVRNKKTQCPSRLTLTGQIPTKKQLKATEKHTAVLSISVSHLTTIILSYLAML